MGPGGLPGLSALAGAIGGTGLEAGTNTCFLVMLDHIPLGAFTSAQGLRVEVEVERVKIGGHHGREAIMPSRLKYSNVTLQRPLTWQCQLTLFWFRMFAKSRTKHTATIEAHYDDGTPIAKWNLQGVMPVRWEAPPFTLAIGSAAVAMETLEIAHDGFLT